MNPDASPRALLRLEPGPSGWASLLQDRWNATRGDTNALRFREALGLPTNAPVVMTGHQPGVFHPGVLAKYLAAASLAKHTGGAAAWLIVDQDETDPGAIAVPERNASGALERQHLRVLDAPPAGVPAGMVGPARARTDTHSSDWPFVRAGVDRIRASFLAHAEARSLAEQTALASFDLMAPLGAVGTPVLATHLARTELSVILKRMADDPLAFVELHNAAVSAHPEAGITPLLASVGADRYELPLWRVEPGKPRRRVYADDLYTLPRAALAPRAVLMTLLVRLAGCDLFIHGAGGWAYDRIAEQLAVEWLGKPLAPMTLATATLTLPLLDRDPPTAREVAQAKARAHRAAHNPALLDDGEAAVKKRALLEEIAAMPRRSPERAAAYRSMHELLASVRTSHDDTLKELRRRADALEDERAAAGVALDRTWAFPLYPDESLRGLRDKIDSAIRV